MELSTSKAKYALGMFLGNIEIEPDPDAKINF